MSTREPFGQSGRLLASVALLLALVGLLSWTGTAAVEPLESTYPDEADVTPDRESYIGDRVVLDGAVVETDPLVIATQSNGNGRFTVVRTADTLERSAGPLETGDRITVFGTLEDVSTLDAERTISTALWESLYMVVVSFVGGCWVLARLIRGWRIDWDRYALVPRPTAPTTGGKSGVDSGRSQGDGTSADGSSERHREQRDR
ncbi:hypothetical protein [Natrinema hispanicum]|uniref:Uncharacterized protein n=1 Tax=Natrinema hispanicum TaxID=392421 RepID=A0A1I0JDZ9_9EURY|nr:hypothetical protein [Natrinema hispanicum]SDD78802.1 hypothetical protein SAMN05192552_10496 [Natrinema hispanicum]SEU08248.1 hypothetical protein SAMN04488694_1399 [Natrinema hispanicum]